MEQNVTERNNDRRDNSFKMNWNLQILSLVRPFLQHIDLDLYMTYPRDPRDSISERKINNLVNPKIGEMAKKIDEMAKFKNAYYK